jgi:hypothetical protein
VPDEAKFTTDKDETMYEIRYRDGTSTLASTYRAAIATLRAAYPTGVIGHDGDLVCGYTRNLASRAREPRLPRTLCWANADDARNDDDGSFAIASIIRSDD